MLRCGNRTSAECQNHATHDHGVHSGVPPEISIIIVSWNAQRFLKECLESLSHGINRSCEVIVVDNGSTDGSPELVTRRFPWAILLQTGANLGFSKANNMGIRRSRGQYVALVNSDVNVFPGCIDRLAEFLDVNPRVGMVGPRIMYGDRRQQSSCRRFPNLWNNVCEVLYLNRLFPRSELFGGEHMFFFSYDRTREVEVLVGCFIVARREAIEEFGVLDETFWMYGEDLDWCRRCSVSGWKVMFFPDAEAIHYCGGSSANDPGRFTLAQLDARLRLWTKHRSRVENCGVRGLIAVQCGVRLLAAIAKAVFRRSDIRDCCERAKLQYACIRALWRGPQTVSREIDLASRCCALPTTLTNAPGAERATGKP